MLNWIELDRGTRLVGAALMMPKIDEAFPAGSSILDAALHNLIGASWFQPSWLRSWSAPATGRTRATRRAHEKHRERRRRDRRQDNQRRYADRRPPPHHGGGQPRSKTFLARYR